MRIFLTVIVLVLSNQAESYQKCDQGNYFWQESCAPCGSQCHICQDNVGCTYCNNSNDANCFSYGSTPITQSSNRYLALIIVLCVVGPIIIINFRCCCLYYLCQRCCCRIEENQGQREPNDSIQRMQQVRVGQWKNINIEKIKLEEPCAICQQLPGRVMTSCQHIYHSQCLRMWIYKNNTCPLCRKNVKDTIEVICNICKQHSIQMNLNDAKAVSQRETAACPFCLTI